MNNSNHNSVPALNPELQRLLQFCNMDRRWVRAEGVWLYDERGRGFIDCNSQYGVMALGHNAKPVTEAVEDALSRQTPAMVQPFAAPHAVELAQRLTQLASGNIARCVFTNSGAETVETAIKLTRVATGRQTILSCDGAYHGKTLGAMAVSGDSAYGGLYGPRAPGFDRIPFGDIDALQRYFESNGEQLAAFFFEPIQGERGILLPPDGYLATARELCLRYGVAMVVDEIQTGLGRTGRLFASSHEKVAPDVILLAKALGGGLFPIGACLTSEDFWTPEFALTHSSTFANNNVACRVGLAVVDTLAAPGFLDRVKAKGERLSTALAQLAQRYPKMIKAVRGRGLLHAIELNSEGFDDGFFAAYMRHQKLFGYGLSSTLAENESVIAVPTLGNTETIRIIPPLIISNEEIDRVVHGLNNVFSAFSKNLTQTVVHAMSGGSNGAAPQEENETEIYLPPAALTGNQARGNGHDESRFAFLIHYTQLNDILLTDPSLRVLDHDELHRYSRYIADMPPGVVYETEPLISAAGDRTRGWLIAMGMLPEEMYRRGAARVAREIRRGTDLAAGLGAQVVGLGAFTSIFSRNGMGVTGRGPAITTGNALTAAMAYRAILRVAKQQQLPIAEAAVAVVGARGSVGALCAQLLARHHPQAIVLVGNSTTKKKQLERIQGELRRLTQCPISITTDLDDIRSCQIVVSATSSPQPILDKVALNPQTIVCDVARPADAGEATRGRTDLTVVDGGLVALPDPEMQFGRGNIQGFPDGIQLACLSETMLLALAGETRDFGVGLNKPTLEDVDYVSRLADRHGFRLADPLLSEAAVTDKHIGLSPPLASHGGVR